MKIIDKFSEKMNERFSRKSINFLKILGLMLTIGVCGLLLLNLPFGIIEPIPDVIPVIGNLDDIVEVLLILWAWPRLVKAIEEYRKPEPLDEDNQVDDIEYIDVKAEVVPSLESEEAAAKTPEPELNERT